MQFGRSVPGYRVLFEGIVLLNSISQRQKGEGNLNCAEMNSKIEITSKIKMTVKVKATSKIKHFNPT